MLSDAELLRYSRHIQLFDAGINTQIAFLNATVSIIGCGGLAHPLGLYLAASGIGSIHLMDGDSIELSNLQRQVVFKSHHLGQPKAQILKDELSLLNPNITIQHWPLMYNKANSNILNPIIQNFDIIFDCSDNYETRYWVNQQSLTMQKPIISGAAIEFNGLCVLLNQCRASPCYNCVFDQVDTPRKQLTCAESGVFSPLLGIVGSTMATLGLHFIASSHMESRCSELYSWNVKHMTHRKSKVIKNIDCDVCNSKKKSKI